MGHTMTHIWQGHGDLLQLLVFPQFALSAVRDAVSGLGIAGASITVVDSVAALLEGQAATNWRGQAATSWKRVRSAAIAMAVA